MLQTGIFLTYKMTPLKNTYCFHIVKSCCQYLSLAVVSLWISKNDWRQEASIPIVPHVVVSSINRIQSLYSRILVNSVFFNFCHKLTEINVKVCKCWQICIETIFIGYHRNTGNHMLSCFHALKVSFIFSKIWPVLRFLLFKPRFHVNIDGGETSTNIVDFLEFYALKCFF